MTREEYFNKLKSFENSLINRSQSNNPDIAEGIIKLKDRYDELELARKYSDSQIYIFNHRQGEYKTTFAFCEAQKGHLILQYTIEQLDDNERHFKALNPHTPTKRVYGWKTFIQIDDDTVEYLTSDIKSLKDKYPKRFKDLVANTKQYDKDSAQYLQKKKYEETPILDRWADQFQDWKTHVVFLTNQRIPLIKEKSLQKGIESIWIDEGMEKENYSITIDTLDKVEQELGVKKTTSLPIYNSNIAWKRARRNRDLNKHLRDDWDEIRQDNNYLGWIWLEELDQDGVLAMRKTCHEILKYLYAEALNPDIQGSERISGKRGSHLLPDVLSSSQRIDHPNRTNGTTVMTLGKRFFSILNQWEKKRKHMSWNPSKKNKNLTMGDVSKLEFETQIQNIKDNNRHAVSSLSDFKHLIKFVEQALATKFFFKREGQEVNHLKVKKPLLYYLYEIAFETETEINILDASADIFYLERMRRRHNNYMNVYRPLRYFHKPKIKRNTYKAPGLQFLTGTDYKLNKHDYDARAIYNYDSKTLQNTGTAISDKSLKSVPLSKAGDEIYWVTMDSIKHYDQKETTIRKYLYNNQKTKKEHPIGKALVKTLEWLNEDRKVGAVSHPDFVEKLNISKQASFIKAQGQNWRGIEDQFVIGTPAKPFNIQRKEFEEQYRRSFPFDEEEKFRKNKKKRSSIDENSVVGVEKDGPRDEIYNYFTRTEDKLVYDALWRPRGAKRIFRIGRDLHQMEEPLKNTAKQITFTEMLDLIVSDEKLIRDWHKLPNKVKRLFLHRDICYSQQPRLKNKWRGLNLFMNGHTLSEVQKEMNVSRTTIHRWKNKWEARTKVSV